MEEISTANLTQVLQNTGFSQLERYRRDYLQGLSSLTFQDYYLEILAKKGLSKSQVIARSGLEIHYAYQILSGLKKPGRDKVLALCIAGTLSLKEANRALQRAGEGGLYPKRLRDAVIIIALNRQLRMVWQVNQELESLDLPLLQ